MVDLNALNLPDFDGTTDGGNTVSADSSKKVEMPIDMEILRLAIEEESPMPPAECAQPQLNPQSEKSVYSANNAEQSWSENDSQPQLKEQPDSSFERMDSKQTPGDHEDALAARPQPTGQQDPILDE